MKRRKSEDKTKNFSSVSGSGFDIDALTSLVTEQKKGTTQRSQLFTRRDIGARSESTTPSLQASAPAAPRVDHIPQEWAEKLFPRMSPAAERETRKVYIGGLGATTTDADVTKFVAHELKEQSICPPDEMIINVEMRNDAERKYRFCFVEFFHEELSNMTMALHDREFTNCDGKTTYIKVGRTKDYPGPVSREKIPRMAFIDHLPKESIEKEKLLEMFSDEDIGKVANLWILRDHSTLHPKGAIFVLYDEADSVQKLITALENEEHEGVKLLVREATQEDRFQTVKSKELSISEGLLYFLTCESPVPTIANGSLNDFFKMYDAALVFKPDEVKCHSLVISNTQSSTEQLFSEVLTSADNRGIEHVLQSHYRNRKLSTPTRILVLLNMIDENELEDDDDFENLKEDIEEEMERYGLLQELIVTRFPPSAPPRAPNLPPNVDKKTDSRWIEYDRRMGQFHQSLAHPVDGFVGRVFAVYSSVDEAMKAQKSVSGKKFNGRTVITSFIAEKFVYPDAQTNGAKSLRVEEAKRLAIL